jgi:hypothetical protein
VIQKAILYFHEKNQEDIMTEIIGDMLKTSGNPNGLHVIKKLLPLALKVEYEKYREEIAQEIVKNTTEMAQNPYANFALQIVISTYPPSIVSKIIEVLKGKIVSLSLAKYSSSVIECCIEKVEEELKEEIIRELMDPENLAIIMKNQFGSYVIQKALAFAKPTLRAEFMKRLQSIIPVSSRKVKKGAESLESDI